MAARNDRKAREKKQKIALAVGGVLFLGLLGIQGPKMLKLMHGGGNAGVVAGASTAATTTTDSGAPTTTDASGTPAAPATPTAGGSVPSTSVVLQNSDQPPTPGLGSLGSLSLFHDKDPFKPQAADTQPALGAPAPGATAAGAAGTAQANGAPVLGTIQSPAPGLKVANLPQAVLRIDGKRVEVALGQSFPAGKVTFRVAGFEPGAVKLAVVGGSFADGSTTMTLHKGQPVTLVNTADGSRFKFALLKTSGTR